MRGDIRREVALAHQRNRLHGHKPATWEAAYAQVLLTCKDQSCMSPLSCSSKQPAFFDSCLGTAGQPVGPPVVRSIGGCPCLQVQLAWVPAANTAYHNCSAARAHTAFRPRSTYT